MKLTGLMFASALLVACVGNLGGEGRAREPGTPTGAAPRPDVPKPGSTPPPPPTDPGPVGVIATPDAFASTSVETYPLLRLSVSQYEHIVADVLGETRGFPDLLLDPASTSVNEKDLLVGLHRAGASIAARAFGAGGKLERYCDGSAGPACARKFLMEVAPLLFRRALTAQDSERLLAVFAAAEELGTAAAMTELLTTILVSPSFTTVVETPEGAAGRLPDEQVAARLALFLWDSAPDAALLKTSFRDRAALTAAAERLMASPRFGRFADRFFDGWLELPAVAEAQKVPELPFSPTLAAAMANETRTFVRTIFTSDASDFGALFTSTTSFVNAELAKIYGLKGTFGSELVQTDVSAGNTRRGLLTHPSLMTLLSLPAEPSVAMRGVFLLRNVFCSPPAPPPGEVPPLPEPGTGAGKTLRERVAQHGTNPACVGCHRTIDGLGLGFENFDAIGRHHARDEAGRVLTGAGVLYRRDGTEQAFRGGAELGPLVAVNPEARACFVSQLFERSLYRKVTTTDARDLKAIAQRFSADGNMRRLVADYVASDAFVSRKF